MSEVCPVHGQAWKTVPAGVSQKTGRAYPSFQTCPVQGCGMRPNNVPMPQNRVSPPILTQASAVPITPSGDALAIAAMEFAGKVFDGAVARAVMENQVSAQGLMELSLECVQRCLEIARKG